MSRRSMATVVSRTSVPVLIFSVLVLMISILCACASKEAQDAAIDPRSDAAEASETSVQQSPLKLNVRLARGAFDAEAGDESLSTITGTTDATMISSSATSVSPRSACSMSNIAGSVVVASAMSCSEDDTKGTSSPASNWVTASSAIEATGNVAFRLGEHVLARGDKLVERVSGRTRLTGSPARIESNLASYEADWINFDTDLQIITGTGRGRLVRVRRSKDPEVRDRSQRGEVLDRLVRRSVLAEEHAVVREHVDRRLLHQRREADRRSHVIAEDQEGAAVGPHSAVE